MGQQDTSAKKSLIIVSVIAAMLVLTGIMWALMGCESAGVTADGATQQELSATTAVAAAGQETNKAKETSGETTADADKAKTDKDASAGKAETSKGTTGKSSTSTKDDKASKTDKAAENDAASDKATDKGSSKKTAGGKASASGWSMDIDCTGCHTKEADLATDKKCTQGVAHESAKLTCVTCHTDEEVLTDVHADVSANDKMPKKATVETVDPETCEGCHGDLEKVAELTADSTALKDDQGTVVNPHQIPEGERHEANPATCTDCHNNHSTNLSKDAMKYCAQCHHRGRFECGTCHEIREASETK